MVKSIVLTLVIALGVFVLPTQVSAQTASPAANITPDLESTSSATLSAETATPAATAVTPPQEQQARDITQTTGGPKDKLIAYLDARPLQQLSFTNFLQHAIRNAISEGLSANIIVLILLFPVIASIIAASRHLIGLQGFGIYIPAVLSVAFVSTGITTGVIMFTTVLLSATLVRLVVKRLKLQYLPRTAMLLWGVSISILLVLLAATYFGYLGLLTTNIFPILIIILLTENFMETQLTSSQKQALQLTFETLIVAVLCSLLLTYLPVQQFVLGNPELSLLAVAVFNIVIGRYAGLRLLEYLRFRSILE